MAPARVVHRGPPDLSRHVHGEHSLPGRRLGGDSLAEMRPRFHALRRARLADLPMDDRPWRLGYARPAEEGDQPVKGDQPDADSEPAAR